MSDLGRRIPPSESLANMKSRTDAVSKADETLQLGAAFQPRRPRFCFDGVILPPSTLRNIEILKSRINNHQLLYETWELSRIDPRGLSVAINFYGPPGTGKTMCSEALAAMLGKTLIEVNYAEIESKYVGETPKNIRAAFARASESDSVLFFDEADSILGRRMTHVTQAADHGVNVSRAVMLKQLDEFRGVVVFATNLARNFDGAFVRRILQHIEVPLPDTIERITLWQAMLSPRVPGRDALDWPALAKASIGFSGGDIKNAVVICLSDLANHPETTRRIALAEVLAAVEVVQKAKSEIGSNHHDQQ